MDWKKKSTLVLFSLFSLIIILLISYHLTLFLTPISPTQEQVFDYLSQQKNISSPLTPLEISHLGDVRSVILFLDTLLYFSLLIVILIITYYRQDQKQLQKLFLFGSITTLLFLAILFIGIFLSFEQTFTIFHKIFFPQGNWQFPADSFLIQTFPITFFESFGAKLGLITLVLSFAVLFLALYLKRAK